MNHPRTQLGSRGLLVCAARNPSARTTPSILLPLPATPVLQAGKRTAPSLPQHISRMLRRAWLVLALALAIPILTGCIYPEREQSQWRWKQFSPEYRPLPGDEAP